MKAEFLSCLKVILATTVTCQTKGAITLVSNEDQVCLDKVEFSYPATQWRVSFIRV